MSSIQALRQMGAAEIDSIVHGNVQLFDGVTIARRKLLSDLRMLTITPLVQDDVDGYKKNKVKLYEHLTLGANIFAYVAPAAYAVYSVMGIMTPIISAWEHSLSIDWLVVALQVVGTLMACACLFIGAAVVYAYAKGSRWEWTDMHLYQHRMERPIPPAVCALAARIKRWRPHVGLKVEYFKLDPFLVVYDYDEPDAFYTVAVWDETGFRTTDR